DRESGKDTTDNDCDDCDHIHTVHRNLHREVCALTFPVTGQATPKLLIHQAGLRGYRRLPDQRGTVRAITRFSTLVAPARLSTRASSFKVAPVVMTSSNTATAAPERSSLHRNAPRTFFARSSSGSSVCGGVSFTRSTPRGSIGLPRRRARPRAISRAWLNPRSARRLGCSGIGTIR